LHSKAQTEHNSQEYAIGDRHKESDEYLQEDHDSQVSNRDPDGSEHFVHFGLVSALAKGVEEDKEDCEGAHDDGDEDDVKRKVFLKEFEAFGDDFHFEHLGVLRGHGEDFVADLFELV
jgi:hypothetical protein